MSITLDLTRYLTKIYFDKKLLDNGSFYLLNYCLCLLLTMSFGYQIYFIVIPIIMENLGESKISEEKMSKLLTQLRSDKNLASKLGLLVNEPSVCSKRKTDLSPLRTKKFVKTAEGNVVPAVAGSSTASAGSPELNALVIETSTSGASNPKTSSQDSELVQSDDSQSDISSEEEDNLNNLERILCNSDNDNEEEDDDKENESDEFDLLGGPSKHSWSPPKKAMSFYLKAADIDLNKDLVKEISDQFISDSKIDDHFSPPRFPPSLWSAVQSSQSDTYRLKSLFKVQENLYLSINPLLDCLDSADKESKPKILQSIQLICSSNLQLNRFRRSVIAPHLKPELRKQVLALPISHNSFFGDDFSKATDNLIKEQSAIDKVVNKKSYPQKASFSKPSSSQGYSSSNNQNSSGNRFFRGPRGRGRPYQRGRGRGRFNHNKRGGNQHPSSSSGGFQQY